MLPRSTPSPTRVWATSYAQIMGTCRRVGRPKSVAVSAQNDNNDREHQIEARIAQREAFGGRRLQEQIVQSRRADRLFERPGHRDLQIETSQYVRLIVVLSASTPQSPARCLPSRPSF